MSANCRATAEKLRRAYAEHFDLDLAEVVIRYLPGDDAVVFAPGRPNIPHWSTGRCP